MRKKVYLFLFFFILIAPCYAQQTPPSAGEIMKEAFSTAKKENKKVFVMFHASWCGWCHKMENSLNDPTVKKFFDDNFVIRYLVVFESKGKINLENPGAMDMLTKYDGKEEGIPFWLVFDQDEKLITDCRMPIPTEEKFQNIGCPANEEEVEYFISVLKKTTSLQEDQLEIIRKRFRRNEVN